MRTLRASLVIVLALSPLVAAEAPVTAVRCRAAIDVVRGVTIPRAVITIRDGRILAIGSDLPIPAGAEVIDLGNATVLPGLIDAHSHLLTSVDPRIGDDIASAVAVVAASPGTRALLGAAAAREMLEAGFTSVRDLGNSGHDGDVELRDAINQGWIQGPRMTVSTRALAPPGGQLGGLPAPVRDLGREEYVEVTGADAARRAVREAVFEGADVIKVIVDGFTSLTPAELDAIVDEAHRAGRKVAAHAIADDAVRAAARAGVDSIEHAYSAPDDALRVMAEKKIFLVPTDFPPSTHIGDDQQRTASQRRLMRAITLGVPIAAGSDVYYLHKGTTRGAFAKLIFHAYAGAGMKPPQILRAATVDAARLLGVDRDVGTLEAGKSADLLAVDGDPLTDVGALDHVRAVWKAGVPVPMPAPPTGPAPGQ